MPTSLGALARLVDGDVLGDAKVEILGAASLLDATAGDVTMVDKNEKAERLAASCATAAVVPRGFPVASLTMPAIEVDDVHRAFTAIVVHFRPPRPKRRTGISPAAVIAPGARLADDVDVQAGATIDDDVVIGAGSTIHSGARIMAGCQLGENVTIYPNAVLYENTEIGPRTIVHANVVLGCHGFGYRYFEGSHLPSAQLGNVQIGSDCEIGAGTTIDRGTYGPTIIGDGTKIDNMVMIAHNCRIGKHNMLCSQVGVAGSTTTGDYVVLAGQVGVRDHVRIGDRAIVGARAGVSADIQAGAHVFGAPAIPERDQKIQLAAISKLPEMRRQLKALQQTVDSLSQDRTPSDGQHAAELAREAHELNLTGLTTDAALGTDLTHSFSPAVPKLGLIAGWGRYPLVVARALAARGTEVYCLGIQGHADPALRDICHDFSWIGLGKVGRVIRYFRRHGVLEATMAGKVHKVLLYRDWYWLHHLPDLRGLMTFYPHFIARRKNLQDDSLLGAITDAFQSGGVTMKPATDYVPELLVKLACLTSRQPTPAQRKDIEFGWQLAKEMGRLDVGQSVAIKDRSPLAIEAVEGTDQCIRRAGTLCKAGGFTLVKVAKPQQDMRFDVPTIGLGTLEAMAEAGGQVLAVEAGRTIIIDQSQVVAFANQNKLVVVALDEHGALGEHGQPDPYRAAAPLPKGPPA